MSKPPAKNPRTVFRRFTNSPITRDQESHLAVGAPQALAFGGVAMSNAKDVGKRAGRAFFIGIQMVLAALVLPSILYIFYSGGIGGPWLAGVVMVVYAIAAAKPFPVPSMKVPVVSKTMVVGALFALIFILFDMNDQAQKSQDQELANLKIFNPNAYVDELKNLGREDEWLEALRVIRPEEFAVEQARRDKEARRERNRQAQANARALVNQLIEQAGDEGRHGIAVNAWDYVGIWNLTPRQGKLRCEHGPLANGKPRPLVLFDADGVTYGVNGPAISTDDYGDVSTLLAKVSPDAPHDLRMINPLLKAGLAMCEATLTETCGERIEAITMAQMYVKQRLKSPSTADFSLLNTKTIMTECGQWVVTSYVDAPNTFGTMIRTNYAASIRKVAKDKWVPGEIAMAP